MVGEGFGEEEVEEEEEEEEEAVMDMSCSAVRSRPVTVASSAAGRLTWNGPLAVTYVSKMLCADSSS